MSLRLLKWGLLTHKQEHLTTLHQKYGKISLMILKAIYGLLVV